MNETLHEDELLRRDGLADFLDFGTYVAENLVKDGIAEVRRQAELLAIRLGPPTGYCMFCSAETEGRFCDFDCSAGWQAEQDAERRNGKILEE